MKFYNVGKIVNTHGIRGEVRVIPTTDFIDERFAKGAKLYLDQQQGEPVELTIASSRHHKGSILVKFVGYDNINDVENFRNHELRVSEEDQQPLEEGSYYYHQIIGLTVKTIDGRELGKIKEILSPGANDVWVVQRPHQADLLLPKIAHGLNKHDLHNGIAEVDLLYGLE